MKGVKNLSILQYAGIGDAWGACFEYAPYHIIQKNIDKWAYFAHHKFNIGAGRYTDDLQMHIAVAEVLLDDRPNSPERFTASFVNAFKRDVREGYAGRFYDFLVSVEDVQDFEARIVNNSEKSGGAMRAACVGILGCVHDVLAISKAQASVTHNTPKGIAAAQATAVMLHLLLYQKASRDRLPELLNSYIPVTDWKDFPEVKIGHLGIDSVKAALRVIVMEDNVQDMLQAVIRCGGDTDTAATIAMAIASCAGDVNKELPEPLITGFENGPYGLEYIQKLDVRLTEFARRQGAPI